MSRTSQVAAAALFGALVLAAGCGAPPTNPPAIAPTTNDPTADSRAATTAVPTAQVIAVTFADGRSDRAADRIAVPLGEAVELTVTSDVADEVHLHGYDRSALVTAGGSATLSFTADIPGVFEIELEELGEPLARLEVS
ncbi:hypothetical protein I4I73_21995 [Pseudonocardia sp. KRD-184]|uniref:EfeO-type cupredoxin-like domain-containing protein n=1 Tax=Pseudonocardia oceani TaxID=2792013 RepID=A0ABS6U3A7_9PSEU|nr:hypothetical protein [Pseudonocardia oceani]MBW0092510.1 hypothetical protein [Pseudonocardia oceani]MBW0098663.1 hypothetical protein [Pseudonocardia oceani]MBW0121955.1 hypothetical protein [Pseudonocardia oceani]MBW0126491.1 hypothetical protein [Pseudonocardia oceani]